jgi:hypothetical protein
MYYSYVEIEYIATSFSPARMDLALKLLTLFVCKDASFTNMSWELLSFGNDQKKVYVVTNLNYNDSILIYLYLCASCTTVVRPNINEFTYCSRPFLGIEFCMLSDCNPPCILDTCASVPSSWPNMYGII